MVKKIKMAFDYDFSGYATRYNVKCADGRTILPKAFEDCDGTVVPMVWAHQHDNPENVLGHCLLECRDDGVYMYGKCNDTEKGALAHQLVNSKDITKLSIFANRLKERAHEVSHGIIREVSLVLSGANEGAYIDYVSAAHSDEGDFDDGEAVVYTQTEIDNIIAHAESDEKEKDDMADNDNKERTVEDVFNEFTDEQKTVVAFLIEQAVKDAEGSAKHSDDEEGDAEMKHNVFDKTTETEEKTLSHSDIESIFAEAKRGGSLRDAVLAHDDVAVTYGIDGVEKLFPDPKAVPAAPYFYSRSMDWVETFLGSVGHSPFSRVKSIYFDITADAARAKGYIKGTEKANEVIVALKRDTPPTTIYKKQKMDRDDMIDITDFDIAAMLKTEMRMMLNEELARAMLVGDGRDPSIDNDKISESCIRPIWTDNSAYVITTAIDAEDFPEDEDVAREMIRQAVKSRKNYKGSGNPILFTTEDRLTDMLLLEDLNGRRIYDSEDKLATAMRVSKIVTVPVMENSEREVSGDVHELLGIIVNPRDYNVGADKGGAVNMFDDFDINFNQMIYLIETRCSGALVKAKSAIVLELDKGASAGGQA